MIERTRAARNGSAAIGSDPRLPVTPVSGTLVGARRETGPNWLSIGGED